MPVRSSTKRSIAARTRGPDPYEPLNIPTVDTPGMRDPTKRLTYRDLKGEERQNILDKVKEMHAAGATLFELAHTFQVSQNTLLTWRDKDAAFADALAPMEEAMIQRVERSLFHKAVGYTFRSEKISVDKDGVVTRVPYIEHVPPDNGAMMFYLKNRRPDRWRDKFDVELEGNIKMTAEDVDPRKLAMAMLAVMRDAMGADNQIEHEGNTDADPLPSPEEGTDQDGPATDDGLESAPTTYRRARRSAVG